jgi:hypothetical protein
MYLSPISSHFSLQEMYQQICTYMDCRYVQVNLGQFLPELTKEN